MKIHIPKYFKSKLFRKMVLVTIITSAIPLFIFVIFLIQKAGTTGGVTGNVLFPEFWGIILVSLILSGLVAYYVSRYIAEPIEDFIKSATEIARGNFDHKINVNSGDEIGRLARIFNYMTKELGRLNKMNLNKIINERTKTLTIIRNIADGVIVTDSDDRILMLNSIAEQWFAVTEERVTDMPIRSIIKDKSLLTIVNNARSGPESANHLSAEIVVQPRNTRRTRVLQARSARVLGEKNELIGIVTILRDITREKEIDKMKTELVSMVAHELRSPLTSICGFSELILDEDTTREQTEEYAGTILKESRRLGNLINKFLDISRIESGKIQAKKEPLDLSEMVFSVVGNNSHVASQKNIEVDLDIPEKVPLTLADRSMMEQVGLNLFSNAIKYSPANTRLAIRIKETTESVWVEFQDQGYGIPEDSKQKIFEKFYRVTEDERVREVTGSGLGLSLVKQIIEIHGGEIRVESELGKGSVFTIVLPRMTASQLKAFDARGSLEGYTW